MRSLKISTIPSAMTEGNRAISGQKAKGRMAAPGPLWYMPVRAATVVSINPNMRSVLK